MSINPVKVLIVDDESRSRENLKQLIEGFSEGIQVCGEAGSAQSAFKQINTLNPDALFLDINMPDVDGMSFAKILREKGLTLPVVFVTAYDQYAIQAFRASALDYLLKPINLKELARVSNKLVDSFKNKSTHPNSELSFLLENLESRNTPKKVKLPWQGGFKVVNTEEIVSVQSDNCYSEIFLDDKKLTATITIGELEQMLSNFSFFRVHNRFLINLNYVDSFSNTGGEQRRTLPVVHGRK